MEVLYFLFFVFIGYTFSTDEVQGLTAEKVVGGFVPEEHVLKYAVAVMYRSQQMFLPDVYASTGAIISDWHVATVAHIFYHQGTRELINKPFYVLGSGVSISSRPNPENVFEVEYLIMPAIYSPHTPNTFAEPGNVAILKIKRNFGLRRGHRTLSKLRIPQTINVLMREQFHVAGYGWNDIGYVPVQENGIVREVLSGSSDGQLRMDIVDVIDSFRCQNDILHTNVAFGNMCGVIRQSQWEKKGICKGDSGAPLTRGDYLVGIAIHGFPECNENLLPGVYINIPTYYNLFQLVFANTVTNDMVVYELTHEDSVYTFKPVTSLD